jgi:hypothetical protein
VRRFGDGAPLVAIDTDCLYFLSSRKTPERLAEVFGLPLGDGLGKFKSGGTALASAARPVLAQESSARAIAELRELFR